MAELFEEDYGKGDTEIDPTEITTFMLYFSKEESKLFKHLCKEGIKIEYAGHHTDKNISDFLIKILKEKYGHNQT